MWLSRLRQEMTRTRIWVGATVLAVSMPTLLAPGSASADGAMTAKRITQLYHAYYAFGVADYCGLITWEVNDGYERRIRYLLLTADIDKETERWIRISGSVEADYQFDNHGLGGFRGWCARDGQQAVREFLAFRAEQLANSAD
jgi:hypothetical protein